MSAAASPSAPLLSGMNQSSDSTSSSSSSSSASSSSSSSSSHIPSSSSAASIASTPTSPSSASSSSFYSSSSASSSTSSSSSSSSREPPDLIRRRSSTTSMTNPKDSGLCTMVAPGDEALLNELKNEIHKLYPDDRSTDFVYYRFLRARKGSVPAALKMFSDTMRWRKEVDIDDIMAHPPRETRELLARISPESFHKFDKYGLPAWFSKPGKSNPELVLKYVTVPDMCRAHIWGMEYSLQRCEESSRRMCYNVDKFVNIVDMDGLSMSHRQALKYIKIMAKIDNDNYPETMGRTFVINAPWIFGTIWSITKGWIDPNTREKIHVFGHTDYQEVLRDRFRPEDLPEEYGGQCRCEGGCIKVFSHDDAVAYVKAEEAKLNLQPIKVAKGKSHILEHECGPNGAEFFLYFKTAYGAIDFTVTFIPSATSGARAWLKKTTFVGQEPVKKYFASDSPGRVVFEWYNHNWMSSETVLFSLRKVDGVPGVSKENKMLLEQALEHALEHIEQQ